MFATIAIVSVGKFMSIREGIAHHASLLFAPDGDVIEVDKRRWGRAPTLLYVAPTGLGLGENRLTAEILESTSTECYDSSHRHVTTYRCQ